MKQMFNDNLKNKIAIQFLHMVDLSDFFENCELIRLSRGC